MATIRIGTRPGLVGLLGASGAVGRTVARLLAQWGVGPLRLGARRVDRLPVVTGAMASRVERWHVDLYDDAALACFCAGCDVVVNCAGPSFRILDRVARAAFTAGADYVDPGGDEPLYEQLRHWPRDAGRRAILTAGMMPGLSGLLPRWLARQGFDRVVRLTGHVGGRGRLTPSGAADYLLSVGATKSDSLAAWRNGARVARALSPIARVDLPFFPPGLAAHPFLSLEAERLARDLALTDASWYMVFEGEHLRSALGRLQGAMLGEDDIQDAAAELARAAELDLFGRAPYQVMWLDMEGQSRGQPVRKSAVVRAHDAHELTAVVAAAAARAVLNGELPEGTAFAAEAMDPGIVEYLAASSGVLRLETLDGELALEQGAL